MANDNRYVSKSNFIYIWNSIWQFISNKFVRKEAFNKEITEVKDSIVGLANADEVYIMSEGETEEDIPDNAVVVVFPDEDAKEIDWTNYYNKDEINEIITKAEFKRGKSAYEVAVEKGFEGTEEEWLLSLKGKNAYEIACELGFEGTLTEWIESLKGEDGYTPQKGTDYFDGYTPQKNVDYFDGYTPQKDVDYFDGYTPQRGKDYWTNEDIATIQTYVDILVSELVDSAPETLDTLWELAKALGNDPNFATTVANQIGEKVDKVTGKGLSTNDYTTVEKNKLAGIAENANNYSHPANHPASMITGLSKVATSNSYNDLDNKPTIPTVPTNLSQFNNDKKFLTEIEVKALIESMVLNGYLGGKQIRYVSDASDTGKTGYLTVKG